MGWSFSKRKLKCGGGGGGGAFRSEPGAPRLVCYDGWGMWHVDILRGAPRVDLSMLRFVIGQTAHCTAVVTWPEWYSVAYRNVGAHLGRGGRPWTRKGLTSQLSHYLSLCSLILPREKGLWARNLWLQGLAACLPRGPHAVGKYALSSFNPWKTRVKILFCPMRLDFRKSVAYRKVPMIRPFVLLVRVTCRWRGAWSICGWCLQGITGVLGENPVPMPLFTQISHGMIWNRSRASAVRVWWLTAWVKARS